MIDLEKLRREGWNIPFRVIDRLREAAAMRRHRNHAVFVTGARILVDGWIDNPAGPVDRLIIGANTLVRGFLFVFPNSGQIRLGNWCYVGRNTNIWSSSSIIIGDRCLISHNVNIHDTNGHSLDPRLRHEQYRAIVRTGHPQDATDVASSPIVIGDDVWIGFGAIILKGRTVGTGSAVGAGSVVMSDVEPWTVVAGNPARIVKRLDPSLGAGSTARTDESTR